MMNINESAISSVVYVIHDLATALPEESGLLDPVECETFVDVLTALVMGSDFNDTHKEQQAQQEAVQALCKALIKKVNSTKGSKLPDRNKLASMVCSTLIKKLGIEPKETSDTKLYKFPLGTTHIVFYAHTGDTANPIKHRTMPCPVDDYQGLTEKEIFMLEEEYMYEMLRPEFGMVAIDKVGYEEETKIHYG